MKLLIALVAVISSLFLHAEENALILRDRAYKIGIEAAIYGYPLVLMDILQGNATYTSYPGDYRAPINQFAHASAYPTTTFGLFPSPNVDSLSSTAWLDLSDGPMVLKTPSIPERYFFMDVIDSWTNVIGSIGPRTSGTKAQNFLLCGPDFKDEVPLNMTKIQSATNSVFVFGRIICYGPSDFGAVAELQKQFELVPLKNFGSKYTPPTNVELAESIPTRESPDAQINDMRAAQFFDRFSQLLQANHPAKQDAPAVAKLAKIGMAPGKDFQLEDLDPGSELGLKNALRAAKEEILSASDNAPTYLNSWKVYLKNVGNFGTNYLERAAMASILLAAPTPKDVLYAYADSDIKGNWLLGSKNYLLHISKENLPPVNGLWSITLYNDFHALVTDEVNHQAIRSFDKWLIYNKDGSLDILIQKEPPTTLKSNWLKTSPTKFNLMMRLYWPQEPALNGSWIPPGIKCLQDQ